MVARCIFRAPPFHSTVTGPAPFAMEQLRFLENGIDIMVSETPFDTIGVDTEDDLRRAQELLCGGR